MKDFIFVRMKSAQAINNDEDKFSYFLQKKLYTSFYLKSKNNDFMYTQFEDFFLKRKGFFDEVPRYEFGRLRQNGPEAAQSARELAPLDHVLSCDALWLELASVTG